MVLSNHSTLLGVPQGDLALRVRGGTLDGQLVCIQSAKCTVGTHSRCTLRLRHPGARPWHLVVFRGQAATVVRRLSPATRLNGKAFQDAALRLGDRISCGPVEFEVFDLAYGAPGRLRTGRRARHARRRSQPADSGDKGARPATETAVDHYRGRARRLIDLLRDARDRCAELEQEKLAFQPVETPPGFNESAGEVKAAEYHPALQSSQVSPAPSARTQHASVGTERKLSGGIAKPSGGDDESIQQYMVKLLDRVRGRGELGARSVAPGTSLPLADHAAPPAAAPPPAVPPPAVPPPAVPLESVADETVEAEVPQRRWAIPPERSSDLARMRELANQSASRAIDTHTRRKWIVAAIGKMCVALTALVAAVLLAIWAPERGHVAYMSTGMALVIAIFWGLQVAVLVRNVRAARFLDRL